MFEKEDNTYDELRARTINQWFDEISNHEDIVVRGGVKVTKEYIEDLQKKIIHLESKNSLKDKYLKQLKISKDK